MCIRDSVYTGWAKKPDHFFKCITFLYNDIGRHSIYQNVQLFIRSKSAFWYMDYSALIKSNTLENAWNGHNMWTVKNGWVVILVKYGFIRLLQRIFNCDKIHVISITSDEVLNSLVHGSPFCVIIYTSYKLSQMVRFSWLELIGIFGAVWFLQTYAKNI